MVRDKEDWLTDSRTLENYFIREFKALYSSSTPQLPVDFADFGHPCISDDENRELMEIPQENEICKSVWELHPLKSPGQMVLRVFSFELIG